MDSLYLSVSHRLPHVPRRSVERASPASADPSPIKMEVEIISTGSMSTTSIWGAVYSFFFMTLRGYFTTTFFPFTM